MSLSAYSMSIELIIWTNSQKLEYKKSQTGLKPPYLWQPHSSIPYKSNIRNHIAKRQNTSLSLILQLHPHFIRRIIAIREVTIPKIDQMNVRPRFPFALVRKQKRRRPEPPIRLFLIPSALVYASHDIAEIQKLFQNDLQNIQTKGIAIKEEQGDRQ